MKTKKELSPKIYKTSSGKYQIHIWYKNKRFRFANGRVIDLNEMEIELTVFCLVEGGGL